SDEEDRLILIGNSVKNRLLVLVYTERGEKIRIISTRKATKKERKQYEENAKR
ncbi:MAG: BrnT family toxin, partial [Nitrospirae bacterium]|nr:BrnT family toxin [Nitrospirota bacterium]